MSLEQTASRGQQRSGLSLCALVFSARARNDRENRITDLKKQNIEIIVTVTQSVNRSKRLEDVFNVS